MIGDDEFYTCARNKTKRSRRLISLKSKLKGNAIAETTNETRKFNQRSTDGTFVFHKSYNFE